MGFCLDHGVAGEAYNLAAGQPRTNRQVTEAILAGLGKPWQLVRSVPDRPGHDRRYAMDGAKMAALGWRPAVGFDDGLRRTLEWYTAETAWWRQLKSGDWDAYYRSQYATRLANSASA